MDPLLPFYFSEAHRQRLAEVLRRIVDYYGARLVSLVVFGSYAYREPRLNSDLDLLVILGSSGWACLPERTEELVRNVEQPCDDELQKLFEEGISEDPDRLPFLHAVRWSVAKSRALRQFPPRDREVFHEAVIMEVLEERVVSSRSHRNPRGIKRKRSNFLLRPRKPSRTEVLQVENHIRILK